MKKSVVWIIVAAVVVGIGFLAFKPASGGGVKNVDSAGVTAAVDKGAQVIDVRSAGEYQLGHIPGAVNVPVETVQTAAASWDKNATYVVYCATGARSTDAVNTMTSMGFGNILHFAEGIQAYTGELTTGGESSSQTIETAGKPVFIEFYTNS
ncbi:MAG: rhodanese-like domain-containing protein [Coriobacteriia bacterium]|nr:rhodanese-like domain-containing protein [Coriobacteriia bacterium]